MFNILKSYDEIFAEAPKDPRAKEAWIKKTFKRVAAAPKWTMSGVTENEQLRRFVDLPKLFSLLTTGRLLLPRLGKLMDGDPFECRARKSYDDLSRDVLKHRARRLKHYAPDRYNKLESALLPIPAQSSFEEDLDQMDLKQLREAMWYLERERLKYHLGCSCWHKGAVESDAMWKIYASHLGVFISSSPARMKSALKVITAKVYASDATLNLADVRYDDVDSCGDAEPFLIKRKAFEHEKEVRLYCDAFFAVGSIELEVDFKSFLEEIVITPFAQRWQISAIKSTIEALLEKVGASHIGVRQSEHMRAPGLEWPGDKLVRSGSMRPAIAMDLTSLLTAKP